MPYRHIDHINGVAVTPGIERTASMNTITRNIADARVYTNTARFDGAARELTEAELYRAAPSVFALDKHESRSERFQPIPTIEVLRGLRREGFAVVGAVQSRTRDASKREFTKHLLRLRRLDDINGGRQFRTGDSVFEILLRNANDGTAAYDLYAGLFRILCLNSLVANAGEVDSVKVRHSGDVQSKVIDGTFKVLQTAETVLGKAEDWAQIGVNRDEQLLLAQAAHVARFGVAETEEEQTPIQPEQLLTTRRWEDRQTRNQLWTTFNIVQENAIRGGLTGRREGAQRITRTREVKGIDQTVRVNQALWLITEHFASLKKAA